MEQAGPAPRWRFLISPRWLAWHAFAVVAFWGMCWLCDWQLHRALSGNSLSWAYTVEWPLFAVTGGFFWVKTIRDEFQLRGHRPTAGAGEAAGAEAASRVPIAAGRGSATTAPDDATARDAHLARLRQEVRRHGRWHGLR